MEGPVIPQQPEHRVAAEGENHTIQNTNEILSRYLSYAARDNEAAEITKRACSQGQQSC
jgi:hypothetical protein